MTLFIRRRCSVLHFLDLGKIQRRSKDYIKYPYSLLFLFTQMNFYLLAFFASAVFARQRSGHANGQHDARMEQGSPAQQAAARQAAAAHQAQMQQQIHQAAEANAARIERNGPVHFPRRGDRLSQGYDDYDEEEEMDFEDEDDDEE